MMPSGGRGEEGEKKKRNKTSCSRFLTSGHGIIAKKKKKEKRKLSWSVASETAPGYGTQSPPPNFPGSSPGTDGALARPAPPPQSGRRGWHPAKLCLPFISVNFSLPGCLDEEEEGRKRGGRRSWVLFFFLIVPIWGQSSRTKEQRPLKNAPRGKARLSSRWRADGAQPLD